ncbi:FAD-binding oxidoreductase [Streptomyces sp. HNM0663]|uniref:FAD-binding oxidoreductase n=1 Tax=Streptomyces chengmaiensis TaxID=3040919 RepID=A0ABT6HY18_9ACTN|nr:FAD-binding oxidoreductase [Streptomyces chengmaiensis]MDH2392734.1 FAD-binding oxidoreductase [Streptomyces chengmaiensis]
MDRRTLLIAAAAAAATGCTATNGGTATATPARTPPPTGTPGASAPADWNALARGLDGELIRPGDAEFPTARLLYNTRFDSLKPAAVAYVAGEDDVRECLAFARARAVPVAVRNGGHSYGGWSSGDGRLIVDVSSLDEVAADGTVGAGAKLIGVYDSLAGHGRTIPGGTCPTVGVSGLALGGGHGVVSRAYGLTCDSLMSATVVTADGRVLTADADENKDLYWALRGAGGGNFGVVTRFRFRTHPAPATVAAFLTWPWSRAEAVLDAWQRWGPDQPDEIWSSLQLSAGAGGVTPTVAVNTLSLGTESELRNQVDRLVDRVGAAATNVAFRKRSFQDAMLANAGCLGLTEDQCRLPGGTPGRSPEGTLRRDTYSAASDFFDRDLAPAGLRTLIARTEAFTRITAAQGGGAGSLLLTALGGAVNRVDPLATAFVHRRSRVLVQYIASWRAGTPGTAQQSWLGDTHTAMQPYASGAAYQNYPDPSLKDWRQAYYGPALDRLTRLKQQYDPDRLFDFAQAL